MGSADVVKVATPELLFTGPEPRVAAPFKARKVTVPVGLTPFDPPETVAVKVTGWPTVAGFGATVSCVVVAA